MALIQAADLSVSLGSTPVLAGISLSVEAGRILSVLGPSGSGKTTLLRALAGLLPPAAGDLRVPQDGPGRAGVRLVFQEPRLLPWMTAEGNLRFALEAAGIPRAEWAGRTGPLLSVVGLEGSGHLWPRQLSGGMAQRLALVRALAVHPAVLLLDEPFAALDPQRREQLQEELQTLVARTGCAAIIVTHDVMEALVLGDEILVLAGQHPASPARSFANPAPRPRGEEFRLSSGTLDLLREVRAVLQHPSNLSQHLPVTS